MPVKFRNNNNSNDTWIDKLRKISDLRVVWNLSFITSDKKYNLNNSYVNYKQLVSKLEEVSKYSLIAFTNLPKSSGVEFLDPCNLKGKLAKITFPSNFGKLRDDVAMDKWFAMRFSSSSRIIGKRIDNIFYVFWIDPNHELYSG